ncbi:MAG TPA: S9 family peptidase [Terriglobales bacterium]|nr:S9 family peptidase [Terriglobales bacterium]
MRFAKTCEPGVRAVLPLVLVLIFPTNFLGQDATAQPSFQSIFAPILQTRHFAEVAIAPDGKHVAWVETQANNDTEYANTVYLSDLETHTAPIRVGPGDPRAQFGTSSVAWAPDSQKFAYVVETGAQKSELRIASVDGDGSQSRLLATIDAVINTPRWSPDGKSIALIHSLTATTNESPLLTVAGKSYTHQRIATVDVATGATRLVSRPDLFVYEYDWSPDARQMVITAAACCTGKDGTGENNWWTAQLYLLSLAAGTEKVLFKPAWQIASPRWSVDGRQIAFIGGLMSDFIAAGGDLFVIPPSGGQPLDVTPGLQASVTWLKWTRPEQILTIQIVDGEAAIAAISTDHISSTTLWRGAEGPYNGGLMFGMSTAGDGRTMAFVRQSFQQVPEVWAGFIGRWRQISNANASVTVNFGKVESLHWTSDGAPVQGWLVYPRDFNPRQKYPMIVSVHGGPAAAALLHWPAAFDNVGVLSALGYFIFYPNPRGSFGQGEQFTQGNVKNLGYGDLRDIEAGVKYAIQKEPIDSLRVGITGWSYGGFMAMWAITQTDMFRASVAGPGVSDWESYYGQTEIAKWLIPYFGASAYDDPGLYAKSSPIRFVKNTHAATLLYVGNEDPICPKPQSVQFWNALRDLGVDTELLVYSREGHGVSLPADQADLTERTVGWFNKYLR